MTPTAWLPVNWVTARLDDVCSINERPFSPLKSAHGLPAHFVPMAAVTEEFGGIDVGATRSMGEVLKGYTAFIENDVLFAKITPCMENGKLALVPPLASHVGFGSTEFHVLRAGEAVVPEWIARYLSQLSFRKLARQDMSGSAGQLRVQAGWLASASIPVAPLPEQRRILDCVDELLTDVDAGVAELLAAKRKLALYRQSLLKSAVEGALTADWRRVNRSSADLVGIPAEWRWSTIGELATVVRGASPRPAGDPRYFGGTIPWITVGSLTADDQMYLTAVEQFVTEAGRDRSRWIDPGTLLLTNSGATLGVPKITKIGGCINDGSVALLGLDSLLKTYLYWFLRTQTASLRALNQGAAQPNLNTGIVRSIRVPVPPPEEMQVICSMAEQQIEQARSQAEAIDRTLLLASAQRQNILRAAFSGQLVPQDPNDETASVLLERIRAQRNADAGKPATRRPRKAKIAA